MHRRCTVEPAQLPEDLVAPGFPLWNMWQVPLPWSTRSRKEASQSRDTGHGAPAARLNLRWMNPRGGCQATTRHGTANTPRPSANFARSLSDVQVSVLRSGYRSLKTGSGAVRGPALQLCAASGMSPTVSKASEVQLAVGRFPPARPKRQDAVRAQLETATACHATQWSIFAMRVSC